MKATNLTVHPILHTKNFKEGSGVFVCISEGLWGGGDSGSCEMVDINTYFAALLFQFYLCFERKVYIPSVAVVLFELLCVSILLCCNHNSDPKRPTSESRVFEELVD
jgi:hypothetical protein